MLFDGNLWERNVDYGVREGSTILTIDVSTLELMDEGPHIIKAVFDERVVEIEFTLEKALPGGSAPGPTLQIQDSELDETSVVNPFIIVVAVIAVILIAFALFRSRNTKRPEEEF